MYNNREVIEKAVVNVLERAGIDNVRMDVNTDKITYPLVVVNMSGETKINPRLASEVSVDVVCESIIGREEAVSKSHYEFLDKVRSILSARGKNGLYRQLWGAGLAVGEVLATVDTGTEISEEEGGSVASSGIQVNFRLVQ